MGSYLVLFGGATIALKLSVSHEFESLEKRRLSRLVLSTERGRTEVTDPSAIQELFRIIRRAPSVTAHHSHPVNRMPLSLPETGYSYTLGQDSQNESEFGLTWVGYPGRGPGAQTITVVRQFRSTELEDWLWKRGGST